ncbi:MAG: hypothetical protein D6805_02580 [Planctomycetota bacterium]|nr:MAG: hypothetical protein D6805_02580 [Planctomycetota bacterium]
MKPKFCPFPVALILTYLLFTPLQALEVGAAAVKIDLPNNSLYLAGFSPNRRSRGVHDPLWARTILFSKNEYTFVLCVVDCIGLLHFDTWDIRFQIEKELGIPAYGIVIASTHTHSAPDTIGIWGKPPWKSGKNPLFVQNLKKAALQSIRLAFYNRKKAKLKFGQVSVDSVLKDSRPPVITDSTLSTIQALDQQRRPIAILVNYSMHPEVLSSKNTLISSDYAHYLREYLEKNNAGIAIFCVGSIGGMQTPRVKSSTFQEAKRVGRTLAKAALTSLEKSPFQKIHSIRIFTQRVHLFMSNFQFILAYHLGLFGQSTKQKLRKYSQKTWLPYVPADVSLIRLGNLQILTIPGELFPELGHAWMAKLTSPHRFIIGLANNELGYIIPPKQWTFGAYEETMSIGIRTAPKLEKAIFSLIQQLNSQKKE